MNKWREFLLGVIAVVGLGSLAAVAQKTVPDLLPGGIFQTTPPNLQNLQPGVMQLDSAGNLKVNVSAGGAAGGTSSTFGAAFPGVGTAAGFTGATGLMTTGNVDAAGLLKTNCVSGCAGGTFNNNSDAVATSASNGQSAAWLYGFNGTQWDRLRVDGSKNLDVNLNANSFGTLTVTGAGGTFPVTGSLTVTETTGVNLNYGAVTGKSPPVYVTGNTAPLSIDTSGSLQVTIMSGSATGASFGAALPATGTAAGYVGVTGLMTTPIVDASGFLKTDCAVGCSAGTFNNNADAVATSATNGQTAAWGYAWNGATWDRVEDDAAKNLKTNVATGGVLAYGTVEQKSPPVYVAGTTGQMVLDNNGSLQVSIMSGSGAGTFGSALPANGTAAGYVGVTGLMTTPIVDASGFLKVNVAAGGGSGGTSSSFNSAYPATGTAAGFVTPTGNMTTAIVDANGFLKTNCATGCSAGTFNNNADAVATSATNGQSAAWLYAWNGSSWDRLVDDASKNLKTNVATGSALTLGTVGGQSPPVYTTGNNGALSLDTAGSLRVTIMSGGASGGGTSSSFGSAYPVTGTAAGFISSTGTMTTGNVDASGNVKVTGGVAQGSTTSGQTGSLIQGAVTTAAPSYTTAQTDPLSLDLSGNLRSNVMTGNSVAFGVVAGKSPPVYTAGNTGQLSLDTAGSLQVDILSSGTLTVKPSDGVNNATFKASGTNAATTDTAEVVALSPNPSTLCTSVKPINQTTSTDLITSTNKLHICSVILVSGAAQNISLVEGSGSALCTINTNGTPTALIGGTTASLALAANGGFSAVSERAWLESQTTGDHLCLIQSSNGSNVSGVITYTDHN